MGERPQVTTTTHILPFERLSPLDFERLCLWLVEREGYRRAEALGEAGSEQGRDILAWRQGRRVAFQCKRVRQFGPKAAGTEIEKIRGLPVKEQPDELIFVVTCAVSAKTRKATRVAWGAEHTCHFWAGNELDHKIKQHPEIVDEFFELSKAGSGFVVRDRGIGIAGDVAGSQFISGEQVTVNFYRGGATGEDRKELSERQKHRPRYADDESKELSGRLKDLYNRRKELKIAGKDARLVEGEILDVRRLLRRGPLLRAGEFLSDGRYELIEPLGKGGFATVWKAWETGSERLVALKVLHGHISDDRSRRERFFRGARKMAELSHPNIVRVFESELDDDGWCFFTMEHLLGGDFEQAVLTGRWTLEERLRILLEAGAALNHAHLAGVVHRDVKPSNILLDENRQAKLSDFDLVRAEDTTGLTATQAMMGTVQFAAPEALISAKEVGPTADVYSLGSTVVFGLYGGPLPHPYFRDPAEVIAELGCSELLKQILIRATAFDSAMRQPSVEELCQELETAASQPEAFSVSKDVRSLKKPYEEEDVRSLKKPYEEEDVRSLKKPYEEEDVRSLKKPYEEKALLIYFYNLVQDSPDPTIVIDKKGKIVFFNTAAADLFKYRPKEVIGVHVTNLYAKVAEAKRVGDLLLRAPGQKVQNLEVQIVDREGNVIPVSLSARILKDERNIISGSFGVFKDLRRIRNAEKAEVFANFARRTGHDLKNNLQATLISLDAIAGMVSDPQAKRIVGDLDKQIEEAIEHLQGLMLENRPGTLQLEWAWVGSILRKLLQRFERLAVAQKIQFSAEQRGENAEVLVDLRQLSQVTFNLFSNSVDAIAEKSAGSDSKFTGRIDVSLECSGESFTLEWVDNGIGIPKNELSRIFELFYTNKGSYSGNGIGLFISKRIVEGHGGAIEVDSQEGQYARFLITLPRDGRDAGSTPRQ